MNNKVLVTLIVPEIHEVMDVYVPVNIRVGTLTNLINKMLIENKKDINFVDKKRRIYDIKQDNVFDINLLIRDTNIRNGTKILFM